MSDDKFLGSAFGCIPRRIFVFVLAFAALAYGFTGVVQTYLLGHLPGAAGTAAIRHEQGCIGHVCQDVLTCRGAREATFHFREVVSVFAAAVFGYWGCLGALHGYIEDLLWFAWFLSACVVVLTVVVVFDSIYTLACWEYTLNMVDEALLWYLPGVPVRNVVKIEVRDAMVSYPVSFVNHLADMNVFFLYLLVEGVMAAFFAYSAHQVMMLAQYMRHGALGMGAVYDMNSWRERLLLRNGLSSEEGYGAVSAA